MTRPRAAVTASVLCFSLGSALACTAILAPRDDVERCGSATDCPASPDERYIVECRFDADNVDLDSTQTDKICVAAFRDINCDPASRQPDSVFRMADDEFGDGAGSRYTSCTDTPGAQGCPPDMMGQCMGDLTANGDGNCDDSNASTHPAIAVGGRIGGTILGIDDIKGQDVKDQFCRSFFCEDDWVCNNETNSCEQCSDDLAFGEGGCMDIYIANARSCIYVADLDGACAAPNGEVEEPTFGACTST